jgi:hypothetical protein
LQPRMTVSLYLRAEAGNGIAEIWQNRSSKKSSVWYTLPTRGKGCSLRSPRSPFGYHLEAWRTANQGRQ